jgi:MFS family permease
MSSGALGAFRHRDFRFLIASRLLLIMAGQMISVAIGWQVYEITSDPLHLGYVGLAQFLPSLLLALVGGHTADRFDRRAIILSCIATSAVAAGVLAWQASRPQPSLVLIYAVAVLLGANRAFSAPAGQAFLPAIVPPADFPQAVAWSMIVFQAATVAGPAAGGLLYGATEGGAAVSALRGGAAAVYGAAAGLYVLASFLTLLIRPRRVEGGSAAFDSRTLLAGLRYVWSEKILLGALSLDLFAVLLGGATALLPIYAKDILREGPAGFGYLRSAPAVGAGLMALLLAFRPLRRGIGRILFAGVFVFGLATILFGLSRNFFLSLAALALSGAADMLSVTIRHTLIQMATPDAMRGRVSAVNFVFISSSNELGEFESGLTARWFGTVPAVVLGGVGTCVVVLLWSLLFPRLRKADTLESVRPLP